MDVGTYVYTYDDGGNRLSTKKYAYTLAGTAVSGTLLETKTYTYGDGEWKDLLTSYNGIEIELSLEVGAAGGKISCFDGGLGISASCGWGVSLTVSW